MGASVVRRKYIWLSLLALLVILPFLQYLISDKEMATCIFCDIINGKLPNTKVERETDEYVIFADIKPASDHHYLAVTKRHIESLKALKSNFNKKEDEGLVTNMESGLKEFLQSKGINTTDALFGFHMPPFISVKHLHMHAIAPRSSMGFLQRLIFRPNSAWFKTVEEALLYLNEKS